jgi:hypothetical protein
MAHSWPEWAERQGGLCTRESHRFQTRLQSNKANLISKSAQEPVLATINHPPIWQVIDMRIDPINPQTCLIECSVSGNDCHQPILDQLEASSHRIFLAGEQQYIEWPTSIQ